MCHRRGRGARPPLSRVQGVLENSSLCPPPPLCTLRPTEGKHLAWEPQGAGPPRRGRPSKGQGSPPGPGEAAWDLLTAWPPGLHPPHPRPAPHLPEEVKAGLMEAGERGQAGTLPQARLCHLELCDLRQAHRRGPGSVRTRGQPVLVFFVVVVFFNMAALLRCTSPTTRSTHFKRTIPWIFAQVVEWSHSPRVSLRPFSCPPVVIPINLRCPRPRPPPPTSGLCRLCGPPRKWDSAWRLAPDTEQGVRGTPAWPPL